MLVVSGKNVNHVFENALWAFKARVDDGSLVPEETRNGPAYSMDQPMALVYERPTERVLFSKLRDANPFFHFMESLWMLAGRNDVAFVKQFNSRIDQYSDEGTVLHGAYGHRWRNHFGADQLLWVIAHLKKQPNSRRAVLTMWDPDVDCSQAGGGKDVPCNMQIVFRINGARLDMVVYNRSNDLIWGACGANAVHLSYVHEFVACALYLPVGTYTQVSANMHIYLSTPNAHELLSAPPNEDIYRGLHTPPMFTDSELEFSSPEHLLRKIQQFCDTPYGRTDVNLLDFVANPMWRAWEAKNEGDYESALVYCNKIASPDWSEVCHSWMQRRMLAKHG